MGHLINGERIYESFRILFDDVILEYIEPPNGCHKHPQSRTCIAVMLKPRQQKQLVARKGDSTDRIDILRPLKLV